MSYRTRLCLVTDIKSYSSHTAPEQADGQKRLLQVMNFACQIAGISWVSTRKRQDRGDGRLYVFSPRLDETLVIPRLAMGLRHGLYKTNAEPGAFGRLRIRAAMARGVVGRGWTGYLGQVPITVCRLVDSTELKQKIEAAADVDLALIVSDELYQDVIKQDFPGLSSAGFSRAEVYVKEYSGTGWIYLPPAGPVPGLPTSGTQWTAVAAGAAGAGLIWEFLPKPEDPDVSDPDAEAALFSGWEPDFSREPDDDPSEPEADDGGVEDDDVIDDDGDDWDFDL